MWRDQIDVFWDGRRVLVIGFFAAGRARGAPGPRPDLVVASAKDPIFRDSPTLVDVIDPPRWRCGHCVILLPQNHAYVSFRSFDGAELRLALTKQQASFVGEELRLLLAESPDASVNDPLSFILAPISARCNFERLIQDRIARSGSQLVWAICQRRHVERRDGAAFLIHLWPTQLIFPSHQSRIVIEPTETTPGSGFTTLKAPFAIMENWLRETSPPCATLRIRIPNLLHYNDSMISHVAVVLVLNQRRRLRQWIREQKFFGGPSVDLLSFDDIRRATGNPVEHPDAVESDKSIVVHSLSALVGSARTTEFDGVSTRRHVDAAVPNEGVTVDVEFFAAALGDDLGVVNTAAEDGDLGVLPSDPGGAPYVRLFRLESDGLQPRKIDDNDLLLDEILRLAAQEEKGAAANSSQSGRHVANGHGQREKALIEFNKRLSAAGYFGRIRAAKLWDVLEPFFLSSFVALVADAAPETCARLSKLGGYESYIADPSLVESLSRVHDFAREADETSFREYQGASKALVYRVAGAAKLPGLVVGDIDLPTQIRIWRLLMQTSSARSLTMAGIALTGTDEVSQKAFAAAETLLDEATVERAAAYCDELDLPQEAQMLRDYLARRKDGAWTSLDEATRLAAIVDESNAYWTGIETDQAPGLTEVPREPPPQTGGIFATVKNFFTRGRTGRPHT